MPRGGGGGRGEGGMLHFSRSVRILGYLSTRNCKFIKLMHLKGLSHEIDFKNVDENGQILALIRAAAVFLIFRRLL
jgi:hypothetical protein